MSTVKDQPATTRPMPVGPMGRNPMAMMQAAQKAKNFRATMKQLLTYMRPFRWKIGLVVLFTIASTGFAIASPKMLGHMTDHIVTDFINRSAYDHAPLPLSERPVFHYENLIPISITLLVLYGLSSLFNYIQGMIMTDVSQKITYQFRRDISLKIGRMPLRYFDRTTYGEVLSRVTNDVDTVGQTLNQSMTQIITSITMILGILGMMLSISWQMTLVAIVTLPMSFGLLAFIVKRSQRYFKEQQETLGHLNGHIEEMFGGHAVMKVFNGQERSIATFTEHNTKLFGSSWRSQFLSGLMFPLMTFVGNIGYVGVSVVGGWLAINGRISIGDIQAFISYVGQFNQPVIQTASVVNVLQSTAASAERVFEFLAEEEETPDTVGATALANVRGAVEFNHVVFGY
ncbi:MAG: ABC transporter ATP-binding protein, partial [Ilumatobacteraceae bacterium]